MNELDTLQDFSLAYYFDADVGPQSWSSAYTDDVSSYDSDFDFAYSYDADFDGGLSEGYVATKIYSPQNYVNYACWTWEVGDGPRDNVTGLELNEKYWLMTHNTDPFDDTRYTSLIDFPNTQVDNPCDTRFLFSAYGNMEPGAPPEEKFNLAPGDSAVIYSAIFMGNDYEELTEIAEKFCRNFMSRILILNIYKLI